MKVKSIAECSILEHSAILLTCIKWKLVLKKHFWSYFEWPLKTGFTVVSNMLIHIWALAWDFQQCGLCYQQSLRSAYSYAQSDRRFLLVAWIFYECLTIDWTSFGVSKLKWRLHRFVWVYSWQKCHIVGNHMLRLICVLLQALSWCCSGGSWAVWGCSWLSDDGCGSGGYQSYCTIYNNT